MGMNILVDKRRVEVWTFLNDIRAVAACVPTMVRFEVKDDDSVSCALRLKLGLIPLDSKATVRITARDEKAFLEVQGQTEAGEQFKRYGKLNKDTVTRLRITIRLEDVGEERTRIRFRLEAAAEGQLKRVYESILRGQRDKMEKQFVANVEHGLGTKALIEESNAVFG